MSEGDTDRVVIITGGGTGIGRAISRRLLVDGFRCVLAGPDEQLMHETVRLSEVDPSRATVVVADVRKSDDRDRLVACASELPGSLYGLVNNAGITLLAPLLDESVEDWRTTFETNVEASFFLSQKVFEVMRTRGEGRVVNIASVRGFIALDNRGYGPLIPPTSTGDRGPVRVTAYAASKGAAIQLTRDLATAVAPWGITVNCVSPGTVRHPDDEVVEKRKRTTDPAIAAALPTIDEQLASWVPLGRLGTVEDIAGPVRFLLSSDAAYITGANLVVDGGWTLW